jgi:hypothetical protein
MIEQNVFEVGGTQYEMLHLPVKDSLRILTRLTKILSEPFGKAVAALQSGEGFDQEVDFDMIGDAITSLGDRLDEDLVLNTIMELLTRVKVQNEQGNGFVRLNPDTQFAGRTGDLLEVVAHVLNFNYRDFLDRALSGFGNLDIQMPSLSKGSSTGMSGDLSLKESRKDGKSTKSGR